LNAHPEAHARAIALRLRQAVLAATLLLVVLIGWWVMSGPISASRIVAGAVLIAPLVVAAPRLHAGRRRVFVWMTLAVIPSLVLAITEAVANSAIRVWAVLCLSTAFALFVLLIAYLRVTAQESG
jgi:hypothetical protein